MIDRARKGPDMIYGRILHQGPTASVASGDFPGFLCTSSYKPAWFQQEVFLLQFSELFWSVYAVCRWPISRFVSTFISRVQCESYSRCWFVSLSCVGWNASLLTLGWWLVSAKDQNMQISLGFCTNQVSVQTRREWLKSFVNKRP